MAKKKERNEEESNQEKNQKEQIEKRIAKEMGLNPRSLIKNIPSKTEQWKLPVKDWIREMYQKRQEKSARKKARKRQAAIACPVTDAKQLPHFWKRKYHDSTSSGEQASP